MRTTLDRCSTRWLAVGALLAGCAALAGCGSSDNLYSYSAPAAIVTADFTGSGHPGIAVAQAYIDELKETETNGYVSLILQDPSSPGTFQSALHFATQGNPSAMAVGALTPGTVDLVVSNVNDGTDSILMQTAAGAANFQPAVNASIVPSGAASGTYDPEDVAICDVNGDGHPDIVTGYAFLQDVGGAFATVGGGVSALIQNASSPGTFLAASAIGSAATIGTDAYPNGVYGIACANLSGNSSAPADIVITSYYYYDSSGDNGTLSIFFHDPANPGSYLPRVDIPLPGLLHRVVIADVNGDGLPDIIVSVESPDTNSLGISGVYVLLQNPPAAGSTEPTFATPVAYSSDIGVDIAMAIAVGDVNGDGLPDIVLASSEPEGTGSIQTLLNTPATPGVFTVSGSNPPGLGNPVAIALGDLNGDSLLDVATADGGGATVYFNQTSTPGTFEQAQLVGN